MIKKIIGMIGVQCKIYAENEVIGWWSRSN